MSNLAWVVDPIIKANVIQAMAGHLDRPTESLDRALIGDGLGRHFTISEDEVLMLDHTEGHVIRLAEGRCQQWFRGTMTAELPA